MKRVITYVLGLVGVVALLGLVSFWVPSGGALKALGVTVLGLAIWIPASRWLALAHAPANETRIRLDERQAIAAELNEAATAIAKHKARDAARVARIYRAAAIYILGGPDDKDT